MCVILSTKANPNYDLILISNRDEIFERSSERMDFRDIVINDDFKNKKTMLMGLDNLNKGTWFCVDSEKKSFAVVLNVQSTDNKDSNKFSRGYLPLRILKNGNSLPSSFSEFEKMYNKVRDTRFFKLIYGHFDFSSLNSSYQMISLADDKIPVYKNLKNKDIVVTSNQYESDTKEPIDLPKWDKIDIGEKLMEGLSSELDEETLIDKSFQISEHNTFPINNNNAAIKFGESKLKVRSSIFIPKHKVVYQDKESFYGTRTTTVLLKRKDGSIKVIERERIDPSSCDKVFEFWSYDYIAQSRI